jgi:hypothetical protein
MENILKCAHFYKNMSKVVILLGFVIAAILLGCAKQQLEVAPPPNQEIIELPPIERVTTATQEETIIEYVEPEKIIPLTIDQTNVVQNLIDKAPTTYWFFDHANYSGAVVDGQHRRSLVYIGFGGIDAGSFFWEEGKPDFYYYVGDVNKDWFDELRGVKRDQTSGLMSKYKEYVPAFFFNQIPRFQDEVRAGLQLTAEAPKQKQFYRPKGPIDWLKEYANQEPVKIETQEHIVKIPDREDATTNLMLYFNKIGGSNRIIAFTIDKTFNTPIIISEYDANFGQRKDTAWFTFDTITHASTLVAPKVPLFNFTKVPENKLIIAQDEWDKYYQKFLSDKD